MTGYSPDDPDNPFRDMSPEAQIPLSLHDVGKPGWSVGNYQYRIYYEGIDPETGDRISGYKTVASDSRLTQEDIFNEAGEAFFSSLGSYPIEVDRIQLVQALSRPGYREQS